MAPEWRFEWAWENGPSATGSAQLRWPALGIRSSVLLGPVSIRVRPSLHGSMTEPRVVLGLYLEDAAPHASRARRGAETGARTVRGRLLDRLNEAIDVRGHEVAWAFNDVLGRWLALPSALEALEAVGIDVPRARVAVTHEALAFAAAFAHEQPASFEPLAKGVDR